MYSFFYKKGSNRLYHKLFCRYSFIIIGIVAALISYFLAATRSRIVETNLDYKKMMQDKAAEYLQESMDAVGVINADLYQSGQAFEDLLRYLTMNEEEYQRYKLDAYMRTSSISYDSFDDFVTRILQSDADITHIELFSYEKHRITDCRREGRFYNLADAQGRWKAMEEGNLAGNGEFSFAKEIRDPVSMKSVGCMVVSFAGGNFAVIRDYFSKAELTVVNGRGTTVYASDGRLDAHGIMQLEKDQRKEYEAGYLSRESVNEYTVYTLLDRKQAGYMPPSLFLTILGIGGVLVLIGELFVDRHLKHLARRLDYILDGMQSVMKGELAVRLKADGEGDELDVISENFNEMCEQLDRYIQKSYLAEIEQKNAEMEVLQSQINPHFLYNTLEAIRMKAICNKDREVARMLYSMAVIFRSQLKEDDVITMVQELHYCKKYLELFEYRYQDKFTFSVECPEELMNYRVIKFILQPVLENYFVHGIRGEAAGNEITIRVGREGERLLIKITDNGRGMEDGSMRRKNGELIENKADGRKSIGLVNVNRRIKAVYGNEYGVVLRHSDSGGICVEIRIPCVS